MRQRGHSSRTRHHQLIVNPFDSTTSTSPATDLQRRLFATCKTHMQALDYLLGILRTRLKALQSPTSATTASAGTIGVTRTCAATQASPVMVGSSGDFDPVDPSTATAICLAEGEKDAATLAAAGLIAFTAPRGAQSLPLADFTELVDLAQATGLPVLLCGDRDEVGREAMRKVRSLLKIDLHLDAIDITSLAPEKGGSVADLPAKDFLSLIRVKLLDRDPRWQKPIRSRAQYLEYKCPRPKRNIKGAGDLSGIRGLVPCGNSGVCRECAAWESYLHIERCWQGKPAQMIQVSGFGDDGSTIAETTGLGKLYRERLEWRLRKSSRVHQKEETPSREHENFMTALALGDDYRASLTMFFSSPLTANQVARERRRADLAGLSYTVKNVVTRQHHRGCGTTCADHQHGRRREYHQDEHLDFKRLADLVGAGDHLCFQRRPGLGIRRGLPDQLYFSEGLEGSTSSGVGHAKVTH